MIFRPLCAALLAAMPAASPAPAQDFDEPVGSSRIDGQCESLLVAGDDFSRECGSFIANIRYRSGRVSYMFTRHAGIISFSGIDAPGEDEAGGVLVLDRLTVVNRDDPDTLVLAATGACVFHEGGGASVVLRCDALTRAGTFVGMFVAERAAGQPDK